MAIFPYIIGKPGCRIGRVIGNTVLLKNLRIHPNAVYLSFQCLELMIRTDVVQFLFDKILAIQTCPLKHESVSLKSRIIPNVFLHKVHGFHFA